MGEIKEDLIENFVDLQDVLSNLAMKIDALTEQMSKLLKIFEEAAKSPQAAPEADKDFKQNVKTLLDQNKIIAKGISIIEERTRQSPQLPSYPPPVYQPYPQPVPQPQRLKQNQAQSKMTPSIAPPRPSDVDVKPKPRPLPTQNE